MTVGDTDQEPTSAGTVLVIDDEQRILNFVRRGLEAEGIAVDAARDGREGLRLALAHVVRPRDPGPGDAGPRRHERCCDGILERKPSQPVLVLSALNDTASKVSCLELGAEDYIAKPFSLEELLARVRARLRPAARSEPDPPAGGLARAGPDPARGRHGIRPDPARRTGVPAARRAGAQRGSDRVEGTPALLGLGLSFRSRARTSWTSTSDACGRSSAPTSISTVRGVGYRIDAD